MKRQFNQQFRTRLWQSIAAIERESQVEVVVIIRDSSDAYHDIPLVWAIAAAFVSYSYVMFVPMLFTDLELYLMPIAASLLAWLFARMESVKRFSLSKARLNRSVEIMARALFQKGGLHHTQNKIGVLFYCSLLEKRIFVLPDRGAEMALPAEEWAKIRADWQAVFLTEQPAESLLNELTLLMPVFNQYIPPVVDDLKELADDLEVDL